MTTYQTIESDTILEDIENHFRVFAGPGAGKTYWLINHIKNIIKNSKRLSSVAYVACISYTNVAVNEIIERLGQYGEKVEVSTIHSFLYHNVVKSYLHLVKDEQGNPLVDFKRVDGHDEHRLIYPYFREWITKLKATLIFAKKRELNTLKSCIQKFGWTLDGNGEIVATLKPKEYLNYITRPFKNNLQSYKLPYWQHGIVDHEDVLYFAHKILAENPILRSFISFRFPYVFIDEFQDTHPIQTQILKWMAAESTKIGVVGDAEQSIYGFMGAQVEDFKNLALTGMQNYIIENNRRSTDNIITLLNRLRTDRVKQSGIRQLAGEPVHLIYGSTEKIPQVIQSSIPNVAILARDNAQVAAIRRSDVFDNSKIWDQFEEIDTERSIFLENILTSVELTRVGRFSEAIKHLVRNLRIQRTGGAIRPPFKAEGQNPIVTELHRRSLAVAILEYILTNYARIQKLKVLEFYNELKTLISQNIPCLSLITITMRGKIGPFALETLVEALSCSVSLSSNEKRNIRTIHQAKAAEFDDVLVMFDPDRINHILNPAEHNDEERRITYVALSRARNRLFIAVPNVKDEDKKSLENMEIKVTTC
jgi:DNA helicase-2/ATP-dependent DNA helicase PcrA